MGRLIILKFVNTFFPAWKLGCPANSFLTRSAAQKLGRAKYKNLFFARLKNEVLDENAENGVSSLTRAHTQILLN